MLSKVTINKTDLSVSSLCYGTNMLGWMLDQDASNAILDHFVKLGGNFIDTARMYGDWIPNIPVGASERAIGAWLRQRGREGIVVGTKGGAIDMRAGDGRNRATPEDVRQDLGESLEHLGIKTIDLYWLHVDNPEAPVAPIIDTLLAEQAAGRIRYFGASNWTPARITEANAYAESKGKQGFVAAQPFGGLALPNHEKATAQGYGPHYESGFEELNAAGLPVIPYAGQSGGYFTKLAADSEIAADLKARYDNPANERRLQVVKTLAKQRGATINEIVLAYLLSQPGQIIPIIGASRPDQLDETVKAMSIKLTADEVAQLRGA